MCTPPADLLFTVHNLKLCSFTIVMVFILAALNVTSINYDCKTSQETESCVPKTTYFFILIRNFYTEFQIDQKYLKCVSD